MLRFWKSATERARPEWPRTESQLALGALEECVMAVLWARGQSSVREVAAELHRPLAYTTVMTTLDRLFKKGLLGRRKSRRAFLYEPQFTRQQWERRRAENLVAGFLGGPGTFSSPLAPQRWARAARYQHTPSRELLLSCLLDVVGQQDEMLLEDLEKRIREERRKLLLRKAQSSRRRNQP